MKPNIAIDVLMLMWDGIRYQGMQETNNFPYGEINDLEKDEAVDWLTRIIEGQVVLSTYLDDNAIYQPCLR